MMSLRPSRYARQAMPTNGGSAYAASSNSSSAHNRQQGNPTSRSVASRLNKGRSNAPRQASNAKNARIQRLNRVKSTRGQHSRAVTVASIQGLMKQQGEGRSAPYQGQIPNVTIQVKPNENFEMSQLSEECSSYGESLATNGTNATRNQQQQFATLRRGTRGRVSSKSSISKMTFQKDPAAAKVPRISTKLVETPKGARSAHSLRKPVSEMTKSKTPRHRNGGQELFLPGLSQQSFATASVQDDHFVPEDAAAYCLAQESITLNESNATSGNSSFDNGVTGSAASHLSETMKSEMDQYMQWFAREQKKLQHQQNELATRIREGEDTITSCLSKSMKEASDHGEGVVASVKKNCDAVEGIAQKAIMDLTDQTKKAEMSSKESYAKLESITNDAKKQAAEVKAESKRALSLYEKATNVLKTVQASADYVQSLFKKSSNTPVQRSSRAVIESDAPKPSISTPVQSSRDAAKPKSSKIDTIVIIENTPELENVSPLTLKSQHFKQAKRTVVNPKLTTNDRNPLGDMPNKANTNRPQRVSPSVEMLEKKRPLMPTTPVHSHAASNSIAPKRRRLACSKNSLIGDENRCVTSLQVMDPMKARKNAISHKPATKKAVARKITLANPTRKNRRKKRNTTVREIDFSLP